MSYQPKQPRTIYVLPPRRIVGTSTAIGALQQQKMPPKPATTYRLIRPSYTLPPVPPQIKIQQKPVQTQPKCLKRPNDDVINELLGEQSEPAGPRKRERLTHLTAEEKMDRRKMKNRMAAQTARDKKKERSQKMEDVMKDIVDENRRLRQENIRLRQEIEEMKQQRNSSQYYPMSSVGAETSRLDESLESAAFINAPLLRVQARRLEESSNNQNKSIMSNVRLTIHLIMFILQIVAKSKSSESEAKESQTVWRSETNLKLRKSLKILRLSSDIDFDRLCSGLPEYYEEDTSTSSSSPSFENSPTQNSEVAQFSDSMNEQYWDDANTSSTPTEVLLGDPDFGYSTTPPTIDPFLNQLVKDEPKPEISSPHSSSSSFVDPNDFEYWARESMDVDLFNEKLY